MPHRTDLIDDHLSEQKNLYAFVNNSSCNYTDSLGLHIYRIDRKLGAVKDTKNASRCPCDMFTHTYIVVVDKRNNAVAYSWGNDAQGSCWNVPNQPEDVNAALDAFNKGNYEIIRADHNSDNAVKKAFERLSKDPKSHHRNLLICRNCKAEANNLLKEAGVK